MKAGLLFAVALQLSPPDGDDQAPAPDAAPDEEDAAADGEPADPSPDDSDEPAEPEPAPEPEPEPAPAPEPEPEPAPATITADASPTQVEAQPEAHEVPTTVNGRPCHDPRMHVPRTLLTMEGWHPCEQARYDSASGNLHFYPGIQVRNQTGYLSPFTLDRDGNDLDENLAVSGRVRLEPQLEWGQRIEAKLKLSVDFVNGWWAPAPKDGVGGDIRENGNPPVFPEQHGRPFPPMIDNTTIVDPRELYVELLFPRAGVLRIGQQAFSWGLGLIANDGNNMDRFGDLKFGSDGRGGLYERVVFITKPFTNMGGKAKDIVFAIGGDLVYRDDNADLTEGDLAGQGILVLRYQPEARPGNWIGGYAAFRHQESADDGDAFPFDNLLQVGVADVAGQGYKRLRNGLTVLGGFEGVLLVGRTRFFATEEGDDTTILQGAVATRGYIGNPDTWLVGFDGGYVSGDSDPDDQLFTSFRGRTGYTVGLLMFPYVFGWQSARSQRLVEDDALMMVPPQASQLVDTDGAVTNAIHIQPKARYAVLERFEVWGGPLVAFAPNDLYDPYASSVGGGTNRNALGGPGSNRYLGTEVDLGIRARHEVGGLWLQAGIQGGALFPGGALSDARGEHDTAIWGVWLRTEIRY